MRTLRPATLFSALLFLLIPPAAQALFTPGPHINQDPPRLTASPLATALKREFAGGMVPDALAGLLKEEFRKGNEILVVGRTDSYGPRKLNEMIGLGHAASLTYLLAEKLGVDVSRFQCASEGEKPDMTEVGFSFYAAEPRPVPPVPPPSRVMVVSPEPGGLLSDEFRAIWENDAKAVLWGREEGHGSMFWRIRTPTVPFKMPYPALTGGMAVGAEFGDENGVGEGTWKTVIPDSRLTVSLEFLEPGWARLSGRVPPGSRNVVVWSGGIPYPVNADGGRFDVAVARYSGDLDTYVQAADPRGRVMASAPMRLPPDADGDPAAVAVLIWEGEDVDLDLHAWKSYGHTQPQDPDPLLSASAVPGARLLFDGDGRSRASALRIEDAKDVEIEVRLFSEFGKGAVATLYVVTDPGDPIMRRGMIIGPRELNGVPKWSRWSALSFREGK